MLLELIVRSNKKGRYAFIPDQNLYYLLHDRHANFPLLVIHVLSLMEQYHFYKRITNLVHFALILPSPFSPLFLAGLVPECPRQIQADFHEERR